MDSAALAATARQLESEGKLEEAARIYLDLLRTDPTSATHAYHAGVCLQRLGKHREALAHHARALELWPDMGWALLRKAECLFALGLSQQARFELHRAWDRFQGTPGQENLLRKVTVLWTQCLEKEGKLDQAVRAARKAVELDPGNVFRHYHLGKLLQAVGQTAEAIGSFQEAARLDGSKDYIFDHLARTLDAAGQTDKAMEVFRTFPAGKRNWYYHLHFGEFLAARGHMREARWEAGASVVAQSKPNPGGWFLLGKLLGGGGASAEARWCLETAIRDRQETYGKDFPEAREWLERLRAPAADSPQGESEPRGERPELFLSGRIQRYDEGRGFGFVQPDGESGGETFFVHVSACRGFTPALGLRVRFLPCVGRKGGEAIRVRPVEKTGRRSVGGPSPTGE